MTYVDMLLPHHARGGTDNMNSMTDWMQRIALVFIYCLPCEIPKYPLQPS